MSKRTPSPHPNPTAMRVWRHNGFSGQVAMAQASLGNMLSADSLTDEARTEARTALASLALLRVHLRTRKD